MNRARTFLALSALLVIPLGFIVPDAASAMVQRVVLVEEFGWHS